MHASCCMYVLLGSMHVLSNVNFYLRIYCTCKVPDSVLVARKYIYIRREWSCQARTMINASGSIDRSSVDVDVDPSLSIMATSCTYARTLHACMPRSSQQLENDACMDASKVGAAGMHAWCLDRESHQATSSGSSAKCLPSRFPLQLALHCIALRAQQ